MSDAGSSDMSEAPQGNQGRDNRPAGPASVSPVAEALQGREELSVSHDGLWVMVRRGTELTLGALGEPSTSMPADSLEMPVAPGPSAQVPGADSEAVFIGVPVSVLVLSRQLGNTKLELWSTTSLERTAELTLAGDWTVGAVTGSRAVLVSRDRCSMTLVRATARSLVAQQADPGGVIEATLGMDRNQLAVLTHKKVELWDAVAARPLQRLTYALPPPPRVLGTAAGHWWILRPSREPLTLIRLSDGRPFLHPFGAKVQEIVSHPGSPWLVAVTDKGLLRLSCFAHALVALEVPPATRFAIAPPGAAGDDASLLGWPESAALPWRVRLSAQPAVVPPQVPRVSGRGVSLVLGPAGEPRVLDHEAELSAADPAPASSDNRTSSAAPASSDSRTDSRTASTAPAPSYEPWAPAPQAPLGPVPAAAHDRREVLDPPAASAAPAAATVPATPAAAGDTRLSPSEQELASAALRLRSLADRARSFEEPPAPRSPRSPMGASPAAPAPSPSPPSPPAPALSPPPALAPSPPAPAPSPPARPAAPRAIALDRPSAIAVTGGEPTRSWREELARFGVALSGELPEIGGELATVLRRLELPDTARRAAVTLYAAYLAGSPFVPMSHLASWLGEAGWSEVLGQGELGRLALLRHRDGAVALRRAVLDTLDGRPWAAIRLAGERGERGAAMNLRRDTARVSTATWPAWAARLGRVALVTGKLRRAVLEARLLDVVAVSFRPLVTYPAPWPHGARLLVVSDDTAGLTGQLPVLGEP